MGGENVVNRGLSYKNRTCDTSLDDIADLIKTDTVTQICGNCSLIRSVEGAWDIPAAPDSIIRQSQCRESVQIRFEKAETA